jgi:dethiobiotin synthetase
MPSEKQKITVNKVASAAAPLFSGNVATIMPTRTHCIGDLVAVKVTETSATHNPLELATGRMAAVTPLDVLVGVLGKRCALKGFAGELPEDIAPGDVLSVLNLGGVIGRATGRFQELGAATEVTYLGTLVDGERILNLGQVALPVVNDQFAIGVPLIMVAGTCMQAGKTKVTAELVRLFSRQGYKVGAAKLTGIACMRDTLFMKDSGAVATYSFVDCGYPSTIDVKDVAPVAKAIIGRLMQHNVDLIVLELGDGVMGYYNVESLFNDAALLHATAATVLCANDFVGAWGGIEFLKTKGVEVTTVSGPATDSQMAVQYIEQHMKVAAANALTETQKLFSIVNNQFQKWQA